MDSEKADTLVALAPGKMGRVTLTRAALRLRQPKLLKMSPQEKITEPLLTQLKEALDAVKRG